MPLYEVKKLDYAQLYNKLRFLNTDCNKARTVNMSFIGVQVMKTTPLPWDTTKKNMIYCIECSNKWLIIFSHKTNLKDCKRGFWPDERECFPQTSHQPVTWKSSLCKTWIVENELFTKLIFPWIQHWAKNFFVHCSKIFRKLLILIQTPSATSTDGFGSTKGK